MTTVLAVPSKEKINFTAYVDHKWVQYKSKALEDIKKHKPKAQVDQLKRDC